MLYLSHKAVHANFTPAARHKGRYKNAEVATPKMQPDTPENRRGQPMWVQNQRNSWHGVDFPWGACSTSSANGSCWIRRW